MRCRLALLSALSLAAFAGTLAHAEPLKLEPGKAVDLVCETHAISVADEAQATTGSVRLRLEPAAQTAPGGGDKPADPPAAPTGRWTIADVPASHVASFGLKHKDACAAEACPFEPGQGTNLSLWAPKKVMPDKLEQGASMSLAALDLAALSLRVSSFRDGAIAALEQGDCKPVP